MNKNKFIRRIPNTLTLINMSLGLAAVLFIIQTEHRQKAVIVPILIILGGIADFFDGYLARKLKVVTSMGKQLDSFADIITFGIAPICLVNYLVPDGHMILIIVSSLLFILAGAWRLARYNLNDFSSHFLGLPITAAGIALAIYCAAYPYWHAYLRPSVGAAITGMLIILLAAMMISKKKVKRISV